MSDGVPGALPPSVTPSPGTVGALKVPSDLFAVIAAVETKGNCRALRFEPATYEKIQSGPRSDSQQAIIATIQARHVCSWHTALMIYSTSFGEVQLMGFNLFAKPVNYQGTFWDYCASEGDQKGSFLVLLASMNLLSITPQELADVPSLRVHFGTVYNGDGLAYAQQIGYALQALGFHVTL
jgi:hypothetical protein